jgi:hypothetical protein
MKTYRLSAGGRRTTMILLAGALAIWGFALWSFRDTLQISYDPRFFLETLNASIKEGIPISRLVPALLMLVLIVATPLLVWNLLEEWDARYTPTDEGLRFESLGIALTYPWEAIQAIRRVDDDSDDPIDELLIAGQHTHQIHNPLLRFLHHQAYGRNKLSLYAGLEDRDELLEEIQQRVPLPEEQEHTNQTD